MEIFLLKKKINGHAFEQATQAVKGKAKKLAFSLLRAVKSHSGSFQCLLRRRKKRTSPTTLLTLLVSLEKRALKKKSKHCRVQLALPQ